MKMLAYYDFYLLHTIETRLRGESKDHRGTKKSENG